MSELTRQERFSMSRQFAKELVAGSIITDAAAQFLALMIEEVHNTKIAPLQAELKRRADMPPTLSAALELPEVRALVDALREIIIKDTRPQGGGMCEPFIGACGRHAAAALAAIKEPKT